MSLTLESSVHSGFRECPPLQTGDHLDAAEFLRRYEAMLKRGHSVRAELIDGIVYIMQPFHFETHGESDSILQMWLATFAAYSPGIRHASNAALKLGPHDRPQPDGFLWDTSQSRARLTPDDYLEGAPELVAETSASSASYDTRQKRDAYLRAGVLEYLVWRTLEDEIDWFFIDHGAYVPLVPDAHGILRSRYFSGLWLNKPAILAHDRRAVLDTLNQDLGSR